MKVAKKAALVIVTAGLAASASAGAAFATGGGSGAQADGLAQHSPGIGSGNAVQVPVHVPVNLTGNTVNVIGLLNPAFGNHSVNR
ncbi:chaplin [Streptomyces sp. NPDC087420]|uniref:chaplin n=1 Tax=Streptomyces sp. NPDC087420 TaxID=3365785 RepID=UPI00383944A2